MTLRRRHIVQGVPWLATVAIAAPARAETSDLVLACDTTLGPVMRAAAARFIARSGVHVHVFPTAPGLLLPQLYREVQNDIVVTGLAALQRATADGLIGPSAARSSAWRNRLVLAARQGVPADAVDAGPLAVSDPTPATEIDGPAVLAHMGLRPRSVLGAIDTDGVRYLLAIGAARVGLLHMTDLPEDPPLEKIRPVPDDAYSPIIYGAAVSKLARRPNPDAFVNFLATEDATAILRGNGLELQQ